jgi:hypothetical protein
VLIRAAPARQDVAEPPFGADYRRCRIGMAASRSWFSLHDTYGIEVADGVDDPLALAIAISIEQLESEEGRCAAGPLP